MGKNLQRITAIITVGLLVLSHSFVSISYAANDANDHSTNQDNVEVGISVEQHDGVDIDINEEQKLNVTVLVQNTGYIKDAVIKLEDTNFKVSNLDIENVKSITENKIELNSIDYGKVFDLSIPVKFNKQDKISVNEFTKENKMTFEAIYVNNKGKEKKVTKSVKQKINWTGAAGYDISQSVTRYLKYDSQNTMLSINVKDSLVNNPIPATSKSIEITAPVINGSAPAQAIVTGKNITSSYKSGVVTIEWTNSTDNDNKIAWKSDGEYNITYIYNTQSAAASTTSSVKASCKTPVGRIDSASEATITLSGDVGDVIEANVYGTEELSKGYMITNLSKETNKYNTSFEINYDLNVGFAELVDKITISENNPSFNNEQNANSAITTKKVSVDSNDIKTVLGNEGSITIKDANSNEVGKLTPDTTSVELNGKGLVFETSEPKAEGNIKLTLAKQIDGDLKYNADKISNISTLTNAITVVGTQGSATISSKNASYATKFTTPTSNASIEISNQNLSTIVTNEDVVVTATLHTSSANDRLYKNSSLRFEFPQAVEKINLKDAKLLYDDELVPANFSANKNIITLDLQGTQTKYNNTNITKGTVVRLVGDFVLDNLGTSSHDKVKLTYTNGATGEVKETTTDCDVVAPVGFVTVQSLGVNGKTTSTLDTDVVMTKVGANVSSRNAHISAIVINNLEETDPNRDAAGFVVLGRIPYSGNQAFDGSNLGSNVNTTLASKISVENLDATVYYSETLNESIYGSTWTTEPTQNAKTFMIVANSLPNRSKMAFGYDITLPNGMPYGSIGKAAFGVYYDNQAVQGVSKNLVAANPVGITTGDVPNVQLNTSIVNEATGETISNGGQVHEGDILKYTISVTNTGSEEARNLRITTKLPDGVDFMQYNSVELTHESSFSPLQIREYTKNIESLISNGTTSVTYRIRIPELKNNTNELIIYNNLVGDLVDSQDYELKLVNTEGTMSISVTSFKTNVKQDDNFTIYAELKNVNGKAKNDTELTVHLPEGVKYVGGKYEYNEKKNEVKVKVQELAPYADEVYPIEVSLVSNESKVLGTYATAKSNSTNEVKSNDWEINKNAKEGKNLVDVKATLSTNISGNTMMDNDQLEYYINLRNNGTNKANLEISDNLPEGLSIESYRVEKNGNLERESKGSLFTSLVLKPDEYAKITIVASAQKTPIGTNTKYTNAPDIKFANGQTIDINSIDVTVNGSVDTTVKTGEKEESPEENNSKKSSKNKDKDKQSQTQSQTQSQSNSAQVNTFKISGKTWFDENNDGIKGDLENQLTGIQVKLFNAETGNIAFNADNKEMSTTTDSNGLYEFSNLNSGRYYAVANFNADTYDVAYYQVEKSIDSNNCDYVPTKKDNEVVAATNEINLENVNAYNIDLGLTNKRTFHLKVDKVVSKITLSSPEYEKEVYNFDNKIAKVEAQSKYVESTTAVVVYTIRITNVGEIAGYARSIVDYIPTDMTFNSELNPNWFIGKDGNGYTTSLSNTIINPGETKEVSIILTKKLTADNTGTERNVAEIAESYNEYGIEDIASTNLNKKDGEDDMASSDAVILTSTGKETSSIIGISIGLLSVITLAVYQIKKRVINNLYSDII